NLWQTFSLELLARLLGLGPERDDARRWRNPGLRGVFAGEDDVSVADLIDAPVDLVVGAVRAADVDHLRPADPVPALDHPAFAAGVHEHGARILAARDDRDQLQLVERELREDDLALDLGDLLHLRPEHGDVRPERIPVAIALREVVLPEVDLRQR